MTQEEFCFVIKKLHKSHDRTSFDCGKEPLNRYIKQQASQDLKKKAAVPYILTHKNEKKGSLVIILSPHL